LVRQSKLLHNTDHLHAAVCTAQTFRLNRLHEWKPV
jgi:hypothetical protein